MASQDNGARTEAATILALALAFGLMGLDRFIINPLFPLIAVEFGLDYGAIGLVSASLALTWGIAAIVMGRLADRFGVKAVLVPSMIGFSALVGLTGLAAGLGSLLLVRGLMGVAEGTFVPACIVAVTRASAPGRVGLNVGLAHMAAALFGLGLAPLLVAPLLAILPSWHAIMPLVAVPGFVMAYVVWRVLPPDIPLPVPIDETGMDQAPLPIRAVAANAVAMACWLAGITTMAVLLPSYLTDRLGLELGRMGFALSGLGLGGVVGIALVPALGDRFGHRAAGLVSAGANLVALALLGLAEGRLPVLFAVLFLVGLTAAGLMALTVGPLTGRVVPPRRAATATGLVTGCGEIFGGAAAPAIAGLLANRFGIGIVPLFVFAVTALGFLALARGARSRPTPATPLGASAS